MKAKITKAFETTGSKVKTTREKRENQLTQAGVDISSFYNITTQHALPAGSTIQVALNPRTKQSVSALSSNQTTNSYAPVVFQSGYVMNTKTHRRWIMAQTFHMLSHPQGWSCALREYPYMYTLDMMIEELRILSKLEKKDKESFEERSSFFTKEVVIQVICDYSIKLLKMLRKLPEHSVKQLPYVHVRYYGQVYVEDFDNVFQKYNCLMHQIRDTSNYAEMYKILKTIKWIKLPDDTAKNAAWVDAFKGEGAFYTLKNMILYHGVFIERHNTQESIDIIGGYRKIKKGYQTLALLKDVIESTNFNYKKSIERCADK